MSEREKFVRRALEAGANVSERCREFGISRKTGYKWIDRFETGGVADLADVSRRPLSSPLRVSGKVVLQVLALRRQKPRWGAKKLHKVLSRTIPVAELPKVRTIACILERKGEIVKRAPSSEVQAPTSAPKVDVNAPNDLWTVDFKGHWRTRNGSRAEPLTVRDASSRFVLAARLLESNDHIEVRQVFLQLFQRHGVPAAIQVDNGTPFIAMRSRRRATRRATCSSPTQSCGCSSGRWRRR
jgi:transposase-like protein